MNIVTKRWEKHFLRYILIILFLLIFLAHLKVFANSIGFASEASIAYQEATQEQKPPEEKKPEEKEKEAEEKKIEEDIIKKQEEILPDNLLKEKEDPFKSPMDEAAERRRKEGKMIGVAAMSIEELSIIGLLEMQGEYIAVVKGPDNVGYFLRINDEIFNGKVIEIDLEKIVFEQEIKAPYSLQKSRKIIKKIHPEREGS